MRKLTVLKISGPNGELPSIEKLREIQQLLNKEFSLDKHPKIIASFNVTQETFEIPDGYELMIAGPIELKVEKKEPILDKPIVRTRKKKPIDIRIPNPESMNGAADVIGTDLDPKLKDL